MDLVCSSCNTHYPINTLDWICPQCGGLFEIADGRGFDPSEILRDNSTLWRYRHLLPLPEKMAPVSMGEGFTPLVETRLGDLTFLSKLDFLNPTGSFKDRGTTVLVSLLKSIGIHQVVEDSSGNAAASLSAYAARAGIQAEIYVPAHASPAKLGQIEIYGARLCKVVGPREIAARAAHEAARRVTTKGERPYYASHYYNPFVLAGMKTTAWELWEQVGRRAPPAIVAPVGHGTNLLGLARGFQSLLRGGFVDALPRLYAAQAAQVAPLAHAFERGLDEVPPSSPALTVAEGIAINTPVHGQELLRVIRASGGAVVAVEEQDILRARNDLARVGLYVEPTSATAVAALRQLAKQGRITELTIVTLTGSGLKATG